MLSQVRRRKLALHGSSIEIALLDWGGDGPLALLHHANGFCAGVWGLVAERLRGHYRVIAMDARGHGDSSKPKGADCYHWELFGRDLLGVAEALAAEHPDGRIALGLGHSFGGIALLMALLPIGDSAPWLRFAAAGLLIGIYLFYLRRLLAKGGAVGDDLEPLILSRGWIREPEKPPTLLIFGQAALGFGLVLYGASIFVHGLEQISQIFSVSPLILSLIITPIATELPESFNSVIWIARRKDTLAIANITGAMVFQSTFPVSAGLIGTPWRLEGLGLTSAGLALAVAMLLFGIVRFRDQWRPVHLIACLAFYIAYVLYAIRSAVAY